MHIERIRFDEVFDVQAARGDFSFRSRGRPHYGVNLGNRVIPGAGTTYAVAFDKPGDWSTVLACRDLASSIVTLRQPAWPALLAQTGDFLIFGPLFIVGGLLLGGAWPGLVVAALLLLAMGYAFWRAVRENRAVTRALRAVDGRDNDGAARPQAVQ
ncbi:hypothetical protein [Massilia sp. 9I]|uniref:hypothetical protein n=1 Tax=Massilia sp. 9I TaxID=2653152 RepID=UPI0012F40C5E|nr:hypothetical protein [Massilia sp. 9I]VXC03552.1 conserved hypothetical protein [Massilia sp. 9I]